MIGLWIAIGVAGGLLGGMGMGGGTLLIPLLTGFGGVEQHVAQAVNLIAFVPMSAVALRIHARNGLVRSQGLVPMIVTAVLFGGAFALVAQFADAAVLRHGFGIFLCVLGFGLLVCEIAALVKKRR